MAPGPSSRSPGGPWRAVRIRHGPAILAHGPPDLRRRPACGRLVGRSPRGRGPAAGRAPAGDGDPIHHPSLGGRPPAAGAPARVALRVRADQDPGRAHRAHLRVAARAGGRDRAGRSGGAREGAASVLIGPTGENSMRPISAVAVLTPTILGFPAPASSQDEPARAVAGGGISAPGWQGTVDARAAGQGQSVKDTKLAKEGDALHVTTGPAATYWNPANTARGDYTVKATFTEPKYMNLNDHPHPYGVFIGGDDPGPDHPRPLYFAAGGNRGVLLRGVAPPPLPPDGRHGAANGAG